MSRTRRSLSSFQRAVRCRPSSADSPGKNAEAIGAFVVCVLSAPSNGMPGVRRVGSALQRLPRTTGSAPTARHLHRPRLPIITAALRAWSRGRASHGERRWFGPPCGWIADSEQLTARPGCLSDRAPNVQLCGAGVRTYWLMPCGPGPGGDREGQGCTCLGRPGGCCCLSAPTGPYARIAWAVMWVIACGNRRSC